MQPDVIFLLSGKRKSGKDYVCKKIEEFLNTKPEIFHYSLITLSAPLKEAYAEEHGLDYHRLLDSSDYKEKFRLDMINWSETKRNETPGYFCIRAIDKALKNDINKKARYNIWIVTDTRRKTDLEFFKQTYVKTHIKTVRILADESTRMNRNWKFTTGVDDCKSECDLDSINNWSFLIYNNNDNQMNEYLLNIINYLKELTDS